MEDIGVTTVWERSSSMENNVTSEDATYYELLKQPFYMIVIYSCAYSAVFLCAVLGNVMVVAVVVRNKSMHNATNYFIMNLAVADILVAIFCVPITLLSNLYNGWRFGAFTCKVTPYLQGVAVCASVNTLAAIAVDRYLAICRTLEFKLSSKNCKAVILCIWFVSFGIMAPWAVFYQMTEFKTSLQTVPVCHQNWPNQSAKRAYFVVALFLCCYAIPLVLICVCYLLICLRVWNRDPPGAKNSSSYLVQRSRVKVVKMIAVVVIVFAFSWLPLYGVNLRLTVFGTEGSDMQLLNEVVIPIAQWLGSSNSGTNPIIYCFFSRKFREGFKDVITCFRFRTMSSTAYTRPCLNMKYTGSYNSYKSHVRIGTNQKLICPPSPDRSYNTNSDTFV